MGKKDTKAKEYLSDNERFADLCNVVLFDGEQVIHAESLEERDSTEVLSVLGADGREVSFQQRWRDLLKSAVIRQAENVYIVLIGTEHQSEIHYAMPVKSALYDVLNYGSQVKEAAKKHKDVGDKSSGAEFLSGFHRGDRLTPVITITVYWGSDSWDAPRSLHEMFGAFDERLKAFIPDYRINLLVPGEMEDFDKFKTELGSVLEAVKVSADKNSMGRLFREDKRFSAMSNESVEAINTFVGTNITINEKEGVTNVSREWEEWLNGKRAESRAEGRAEGQAEGRAEERRSMIRRMLSKGKTPEEIADLCGYDLAEVEAVEKEMLTLA